ncbi:MAG: VCBS repeat-containing protein [Candidatus Cloacimonetes bacterium]|nr:VCBS repeat-containing protein [Candidatus Cloacimonadota bacterium]
MRSIILFIILFPPILLCSLSFIQLSDHDIPGVSQSSIDWGDYDNDGNLDLLVTGVTSSAGRISRVYMNSSDGILTYQENISLVDVSWNSGLWADYTNNGHLDIVISGLTNESQLVTKIFNNNGDGTFTENTAVNLPGTREGSLNWVDFNNNGWLDLFITGYAGTELGNIARLYQNNGDGTFTWREEFEFPGIRYSDSVWGDLNNNGYPDLIIAGRHDNMRITKLYINNLGNGFELQDDSGLPGVESGSLSLGDYNNDGLLDILITGTEVGVTRISRVYKNNGDGTFSNIANFDGVAYSDAIWVDINNNGLLDVAYCGAISGVSGVTAVLTAKLFLNNGNETFSEVTDFEPTGLSNSTISAVDINNNGKTDLIITGMISSTEREFNIYMNQIDIENSIPAPPQILHTIVGEENVTFQWSNGLDAETPLNGLSYNVWLKQLNSPNLQLMAPMADLNSGFRKVGRPGNAGYSNSFVITGLPDGQYEWAVQTIDSAYAGSMFSEWQTFNFPDQYLPAPSNVSLIREGSDFILSWDIIEDANHYKIYGSEDPYSEQWEYLDMTIDNEWVVSIYHQLYFFRVVAVVD